MRAPTENNGEKLAGRGKQEDTRERKERRVRMGDGLREVTQVEGAAMEGKRGKRKKKDLQNEARK